MPWVWFLLVLHQNSHEFCHFRKYFQYLFENHQTSFADDLSKGAERKLFKSPHAWKSPHVLYKTKDFVPGSPQRWGPQPSGVASGWEGRQIYFQVQHTEHRNIHKIYRGGILMEDFVKYSLDMKLLDVQVGKF